MIFPSRDLIKVIGNVCFLNGPISGYRACSRRGQGQPRSMRTTLTRHWMQARTKIRGKRYRLRWDVTSKWKVRRGESRDEGGGRDACKAFGAQSSSGWWECFAEEGETTARLDSRKVGEMRDTGWDLLSSSCGSATRILTRHNNYECNQRRAREFPESRVLLSPRLAASCSSEEERTRAT